MTVEELQYARRTLRYVEDTLHQLEKSVPVPVLLETPTPVQSPTLVLYRGLRRLVFGVRQLIESDLKRATGRLGHNGGNGGKTPK